MGEQEKRIKLAEAMGKFERYFHPFTNPTDDYSVLEWMRGHQENGAFARELQLESMWSYEIGDNARAALKVMGESDG